MPAYRRIDCRCSVIILTDVALPKTTLMSARVGIPSILIACANVRLQFSWACVPDQLSTNWEAVDPFLKICWSGVSVSGFFLDWGICPGDIITVICF